MPGIHIAVIWIDNMHVLVVLLQYFAKQNKTKHNKKKQKRKQTKKPQTKSN